jgi:hypothetical protein
MIRCYKPGKRSMCGACLEEPAVARIVMEPEGATQTQTFFIGESCKEELIYALQSGEYGDERRCKP